MCLYSRQRRLKLSRKEIVCYKIFKVIDGDKVFTPYRYMFITGEQFYNKTPIKANEKIKCGSLGLYYLYDIGLIHAYLDLDTAKFRISSPTISLDRNCEFIICKCHIPKYTRHVYGLDREIAAKKIIIDEIIENE